MSEHTETLKEFLIGLGFNIDEAGLQKFGAVVGSSTVAAVALGAAVVSAAAATVYGIKKIADRYFELDRLATRIHSTTAAIEEYIEMGEIMGVGHDTVIDSLKSLNRAMSDTSMHIGRARKVFEQLGINVTDAGGKLKPTVEVMDELALKFQTLDRGKALRIMERLGIDEKMLKLFNADFAKLRHELDEINKASGFEIGKAVAESKAFTMSWRAVTQELEKFKILFGKVVDNIAISAMPRIRYFMDKFTAMLVDMRKKVMENLPQIQSVINKTLGVLMVLVNAVGVIAFRAFGLLKDIVIGIISEFSKLDSTTQTVIIAIMGIATAFKFLSFSILASPVGWVLALAAALLLLYDDYRGFQEGKESLIDWDSEGAQTFLNILSAIWEVFKGLIVASGEGWGYILDGIYALCTWAQKVIDSWGPVRTWFETFLNWLLGKFDAVIDKVKTFGLNRLQEMAQGFVASAGGMLPATEIAGGGALGGGTGGPVAPLLGPTNASANQVKIEQKTEINVNGSPDPAATGRAVMSEQGGVNGMLYRSFKTALQ